MDYPASMENLIKKFSQLPSVGPKTAERYVFYLLRQNPEYLQELAQNIAELKEKTSTCRKCGVLSESKICPICSDEKRNQEILCIVANTRDLIIIEKTKEFNGSYLVLGGLISPIEDINPENLNFGLFGKRIGQNNIKEVIIALSPNLDGETTALYIIKLLKNKNIKITRLARGLPAGSSLEYADNITLGNALRYRSCL